MTGGIDTEIIAKSIYEATRVEAMWSKRPVIPERWKDRDKKFRSQFIQTVSQYLDADKLPSPKEAHDSWVKAYKKMGWTYGEKRDVEKKTHPDMVAFEKLPKDERDKDAIFLAFVWLVKTLLQGGCHD
jgi:hypothetical protein